MERGNPSNSANDEDIDTSLSHETWEKLLGSQNWEGLLHPLNLNLRKLILRCGDFCHSAYDTFAGVHAEDSFHDVKLPEGYQYHSPFYATTTLNKLEKLLRVPALLVGSMTCRDHNPHWMGYCASTTDEASGAIGRREVYIAWRGTQRLFEWRNNLAMTRKSARRLLREFDGTREKTPRVMRSWLGIYTSTEPWTSSAVRRSARHQVNAEVGKLLEKYKNEKISIVVTGHSLGGILAVLTAFDVAENLVVGEDVRVAAVVFGCPRVGNLAFRERVKRLPNLNILHVKNKLDVVTRMPPARRVGTELVVDSRASDVAALRDSKNPGLWHDLETCLHMVSGWDGPGREFVRRVQRSDDRLMRAAKPFKYVRFEIRTWVERVKKIFHDHDNSDSEISDDDGRK